MLNFCILLKIRENFAKKIMRKFYEKNENFAKNTEFLRTNEAFCLQETLILATFEIK